MLFGSHEKSLIFHGEDGDKGNSDGGSGEKGSSDACGGGGGGGNDVGCIKEWRG